MSDSPLHSERTPIQGGFRRSFTIPSRSLSIHEKAGLDKTDADADVLYSHPAARIFSFSPPTDSIKPTSPADIPPDTDYPIDAVETLPWRSRTENLVASGVMIIEKVRGSTNFLKCQSVMHAILRNSQCWCVDGESKFVLRVRKFQYYRIELPSATGEEKAKVEELKKVFPTVMRYERTPCPFIRAFIVDLPDDAITPRRKGAWKRRDSSLSNAPDTDTPLLRRTKNEKSWSPRTPPTSYPRGGPSFVVDGERGRSGGPSPLYRRSSLFEDYRNSSPSNRTVSDDGTDSEHQGSEHESEGISEPDRSSSRSPRKQLNSTGRVRERSVSHLIKDREVAIQSSKNDSNQRMSKPPRKEQRMADLTQVDQIDLTSSNDEVQAMEQEISQQEQEPDAVSNKETSIQTNARVKSAIDQTRISDTDDDDDDDDDDDEDTRQTSGVEATRKTSINEDIASEPLTTVDPQGALTDTDSSSSDKDSDELELSQNGAVNEMIDTSEGSSTSSEDGELHRVEETQSAVAELVSEDIRSTLGPSRTSPVSIDSSSEVTSDSDSESDLVSDSEPEEEQQPRPLPQQEQRDVALLLDEAASDSPLSIRRLELETRRQSFGDDYSTETASSDNSVIDEIASADAVSQQLPLPPPAIVSEHKQPPLQIDVGSQLRSSKRDESDNDDGNPTPDDLSPVSSVDSFYTIASIAESPSFDGQPSFGEDSTAEHRGRLSHTKFQHKRELSEMTVTASSLFEPASPEHTMAPQQDYGTKTPSLHHSSASESSWTDPATPSSTNHGQGLRQRNNGQRSFSPMPPASTIFTGDRIRHDSGSGHMTKAILQKIVVKPIELAVLVVHILARIASGATVNDLLSGDLFRKPEHQRKVSGFADQLTGGQGNSDTEDDYGVPIRGRKRTHDKKVISTIFDEGDEDDLEDVD